MKEKIVGIMVCILVLAIAVPLVAPIKANAIQINGKTNTYDQIHITSHPATSEEIKKMEQQCGIFDPNKKYNIIYEGHGTGLAPPTEADYNSMIGSLQIVDTISSNQPLLSSCDLSNDPCFPMVGNQMGQSSCSAWAATYYTTGFAIGKNLNWTQASTGDTTQLLSPAWTYNKCNKGYDYGSTPYTNMQVIQTVGCSRLCTMPYIASDPVSWGNESAWRDAPPYRVNNIYQIDPPYNNSTISSIKTLLSGGQPVTFGLDYLSYLFFGSDDVLGSDAMQPNGLSHANTIVGYNDSKTDAETGETGALKVVNSWGSNWGPNYNGYYWITYQAFLGDWNTWFLNFDDVLYVNSTPTLLAVWELNPAGDRSAFVQLGIGSYEHPLATRNPVWDGCSVVMHQFPFFMCLDVTEFYSIWVTPIDDFFLRITDAINDGIIISFKVEFYQYGYSPGNATSISDESPDVPKNTPCHVGVYFPCPLLPVFGTPNPVNGSTHQSTSLSWSIPINDPEGDVFSWTIHCSNGQTNSGTNATNGTKTLEVSGLAYSTLYRVWVNATDPNSGGLSRRCWYTFTTDYPPNTPTITGPEKGKPGNNYKYTITGTDPENDMVSAYIMWGDDTITNWTTFYNSGESFSITHSWAKKGTYTIQVKVKDTYGAESGWTTLSVTMPKSFDLTNLFLHWFFERFPNAFPILRQLMGY